MNKPHIIRELENHLGKPLTPSSSDSPEAFMRYRRRDEDRNQYLLDGDTVIGLNMRTNDLTEFPFLSHPALQSLRALNLSENKLNSLDLSALPYLELLDLSDNEELRELSFGEELHRLKTLDISDSGLTALTLPPCPTLEKLDAARNRLKTVEFAVASPLLKCLDLSGNKELTKLSLPAGFEALVFLYLNNAGLQSLKIEGELPLLRVLNVADNQLEKLPGDIILDSPLTNLYAEGNSPRNIPRLFLEGDSLDQARTWFQELRDYPHEKNKVVKLMITGNGDVGKTTLMCALESDAGKCVCEENHTSTHGIQIGTWEQPGIQYNYWDFGGQEVYHGTHQLFLASEALQLIVFDPKTEGEARKNKRTPDRIRKDQLVFNHPIEYWYETAREISPRSQFLIAQNKKDILPKKDLRVFDYAGKNDILFVHVDAKTGENLDDLTYFLKKRAGFLPDYLMEMPASWLRVRQFFIDNVEKENPQRLVSKSFFENTLCKDIAPASRKLLFDYLHHSGFLYYHPNLGDQIIADQRWALDAIYKPLERNEDHYLDFRDMKGIIRVSKLFRAFGPDYTDEEKWLFLSFMESCRLCFLLNEEKKENENAYSNKYVFPEFLPGEKPVERVKDFWENEAQGAHVLRYRMPWVHYYRVQSFIAALGRKTELDLIWRYGIDVQTKEGRFMVELDYDEKALLVSIEATALPQWLGPILDEFHGYREERVPWEISEDGGANFQPFDREKWSHRQATEPGQIGEEDTRKKGSFGDITNARQTLDREYALFLAATPATQGQISYEREHFKIKRALDKSLETRGKVEFIITPSVSPADMIDLIDTEEPHILHFIGHGEEADPDTGRGGGLVFFSDNRREEEKLNTREAKSVFEKICQQQPQLKFVFLNACFSEPQAAAISSAGLYAVGTSDKIGSATAELFAAGFYRKYAQTKDIEAAAKFGLTHASAKRADAAEFIHLFHEGKRVSLFNPEP